MRVIAGSARRIQLVTPKGLNTRPTTDRIKETLFNMLQRDLADARFLDLFSGSGGIGIEAVSRGAKEAVLVENEKNALEAIGENIRRTHLDEACKVMAMDYLGALKVLAARGEPFDLIFMDPPYDLGLEKKALEYIKDTPLIKEETLIIFEASLDTEASFTEAMGYEIHKTKLYKTNQHIFLTWKGNL